MRHGGAFLILGQKRVAREKAQMLGRVTWSVLLAMLLFAVSAPFICTAGSHGSEECSSLLGVRYEMEPGGDVTVIYAITALIALAAGVAFWLSARALSGHQQQSRFR